MFLHRSDPAVVPPSRETPYPVTGDGHNGVSRGEEAERKLGQRRITAVSPTRGDASREGHPARRGAVCGSGLANRCIALPSNPSLGRATNLVCFSFRSSIGLRAVLPLLVLTMFVGGAMASSRPEFNTVPSGQEDKTTSVPPAPCDAYKVVVEYGGPAALLKIADYSIQSVMSAYRREAKRTHPDKIGGDGCEFKAVALAKDMLIGKEQMPPGQSDYFGRFDTFYWHLSAAARNRVVILLNLSMYFTAVAILLLIAALLLVRIVRSLWSAAFACARRPFQSIALILLFTCIVYIDALEDVSLPDWAWDDDLESAYDAVIFWIVGSAGRVLAFCFHCSMRLLWRHICWMCARPVLVIVATGVWYLADQLRYHPVRPHRVSYKSVHSSKRLVSQAAKDFGGLDETRAWEDLCETAGVSEGSEVAWHGLFEERPSDMFVRQSLDRMTQLCERKMNLEIPFSLDDVGMTHDWESEEFRAAYAEKDADRVNKAASTNLGNNVGKCMERRTKCAKSVRDRSFMLLISSAWRLAQDKHFREFSGEGKAWLDHKGALAMESTLFKYLGLYWKRSSGRTQLPAKQQTDVLFSLVACAVRLSKTYSGPSPKVWLAKQLEVKCERFLSGVDKTVLIEQVAALVADYHKDF